MPATTPHVSTRVDPRLHELLRAYKRKTSDTELDYPSPPSPIDPSFMCYCADAHELAKHSPFEPATARAYQAFVDETLAQFDWLVSLGRYKVEPWPHPGEPYGNSAELQADIRENRHLWVLPTGDMPSDHPLAKPSHLAPFVKNDLLRALHDLATHGAYGLSFRARDEDTAYRTHAMMYSRLPYQH